MTVLDLYILKEQALTIKDSLDRINFKFDSDCERYVLIGKGKIKHLQQDIKDLTDKIEYLENKGTI